MRKIKKSIIELLASLFLTVLISISLFHLDAIGTTEDGEVEGSIQTFSDWCLRRAEFPDSTQSTIQYLLEDAGTENCETAERTLLNRYRFRINVSIQTDFRPFTSLPQIAILELSLEAADTASLDLTPLSRLDNLKRVEVYGNVEDLSPFSILQGVEYFSVSRSLYPSSSNKEIEDLSPLASLLNLKELHITSDQPGKIKDLTSLSPLLNLRELLIKNQSVEVITPLRSLTQIEHLTLSRNPIEDLSPLEDMRQLTYLNVSRSEVNDLSSLANLESLTELSIGFANVSNLSPLQRLQNLGRLGLANNQITDITPLANLKNLENLGLHGNNISDLSALENLTQLRLLSLDDNPITDLSPLANLTNLEFLSLPNDPTLDLSPLDDLVRQDKLEIRQDQGRCRC